MFSRILVKLIDQAIVPAVLLVVTKIVSVALLSQHYGLDVRFSSPIGFVFGNAQDYLFINSYSTLAMICILAVGLIYILIKSLIFHNTHIHPGLTARLFSLRLSTFIQTSYDLYSQGVVWLSYLYLLVLVTGVMAYFGIVYVWVFWAALVLAIISTVLLVFDIEREMEFGKGVKSTEEAEELVLKMEV